jgi:hypothetical protein
MASGVEAVGRVDEQTTLAQSEDGNGVALAAGLGSLEAGAVELGVASGVLDEVAPGVARGVLDADRLAVLEGAAAQAHASKAAASVVASRVSFMSLVQRELTFLVTAGYSPTGVAEAMPEGSLRVAAVPREAWRPVFECLVLERHRHACAPDSLNGGVPLPARLRTSVGKSEG